MSFFFFETMQSMKPLRDECHNMSFFFKETMQSVICFCQGANQLFVVQYDIVGCIFHFFRFHASHSLSIISRQDLAVILTRYAESTGTALPELREYQGFNDSGEIGGYATEAVAALFKAEIINGKPGNLFDPAGQATRAETAAMLHRFLEAIK